MVFKHVSNIKSFAFTEIKVIVWLHGLLEYDFFMEDKPLYSLRKNKIIV